MLFASKLNWVENGYGRLRSGLRHGLHPDPQPPIERIAKTLAGRRIGLIAFPETDSKRLETALLQRSALVCRFENINLLEALPQSAAEQPFDLGIVHLNGEGALSYVQGACTPLLLAGSAETLSEYSGAAPPSLRDFVLAPWEADEVALRTCQLLYKADRTERREIPSPAEPSFSASPENPTVVIADDDPAITALVQLTLRKFDVQCRIARDGHEALSLVRSVLPRAVVLDVNMPGFDGFDLTAILKRHNLTRSIGILILTARQKEDDVIRGFGYGADDFMTKPFNPLELAARVLRLLR